MDAMTDLLILLLFLSALYTILGLLTLAVERAWPRVSARACRAAASVRRPSPPRPMRGYPPPVVAGGSRGAAGDAGRRDALTGLAPVGPGWSGDGIAVPPAARRSVGFCDLKRSAARSHPLPLASSPTAAPRPEPPAPRPRPVTIRRAAAVPSGRRTSWPCSPSSLV
jgi:hypothetical protein